MKPKIPSVNCSRSYIAEPQTNRALSAPWRNNNEPHNLGQSAGNKQNTMNTNKNNFILCVDDDPEDLELLQHALVTAGSELEIVKAQNGEEALNMLREMKQTGNLPCLVVLDINMPRMDGKQTLVSIQSDEVLATVPVVIFTTSSSAMDRLFFAKKHVEYIVKPVNFDTFYTIASRLLTYCKCP